MHGTEPLQLRWKILPMEMQFFLIATKKTTLTVTLLSAVTTAALRRFPRMLGVPAGYYVNTLV
jgi:hypothetical protein